MAFRPLSRREVRWRPEDGEGLEHLTLEPTERGPLARSVVAGTFRGRPFGVRYEIACDETWRTIVLEIAATDGRGLSLVSPEPGEWVERSGRPRPELSGCIDVDLSGSPFTNTLPIRRTGLAKAADGPREFRMLYVPFDTFEPVVDEQRYTELSLGLYRYEAVDRSFSADLALDEDGLVTDYPGLFRRLPGPRP